MTGRRRSDLALGAALSLMAHGALLGAASSWAPAARAPVALGRAEPAVEITTLSPERLRALVDPAPRTARVELREVARRHPTSALHWPESNPASIAADEAWRIAAHLDPPPALEPRAVEHSRAQTLAPAAEPLFEVTRPAPQTAPPVVDAPGPDLGALEGLVLQREPLLYPPGALRAGIEGTVTVGLEVGQQGRVARTWILASSGSRQLDRAARENLLSWRFDPRALEAARVGRVFRQDVRFELR